MPSPSSPNETAAGRFPDTRWSLVLSGDRGLALEHLAAAYWRPIYGYVRARWARDEAEALDTTQEFFARLVSGELLARAEPGRGRFRAYVRAALANFLSDEARRRRAQRRGGDRPLVPLDGVELDLPDTRGRAPEEALDELWRAEVLQRAAHELERELEREGKRLWWSLFESQVLAGEALSRAQLAERHGISTTDVANWLARGRVRYRAALIRVVQETVADERALARELEWLLGEARA